MPDPCLREEYRFDKNILTPLCLKNAGALFPTIHFGTRMFPRINYSGPTFSREITPKYLPSPAAPFRAFYGKHMIFQEISLAITSLFLILVNICATRARHYPARLQRDCHCAKQLIPLFLPFPPLTLRAGWSRSQPA